MKKILYLVRVPDYPEFKKRAKEAAHWTEDQWHNRANGRTQLTESERQLLLKIAEETSTAESE